MTSRASALNWSDEIELVGVTFLLTPQCSATLSSQYATGLHAWFLDQVRQDNPGLSAKLHDQTAEKAFTISRLEGEITPAGKQLQLSADQSYRWSVTALSREVSAWMKQWVKHPPTEINLRRVHFQIKAVRIALPPTTYSKLAKVEPKKSLTLSFLSPTSFRRKGHHFPLPFPTNIFQSYLRRWNNFTPSSIDQDTFLDWIDETVIILRHRLETMKVAAGKRGSVTGFVGAVEYRLSSSTNHPEFEQVFSTLGQLAPYCGTGHKTTFGLGQTRLGWQTEIPMIESFTTEYLLAQRIEQLTDSLMQTQKRKGGTRALNVSETRATILARQEFGESLQEIATDLDMPYETVKTYAKLARQALK